MNNKGFIGLIGLILTAAIICLLAYFSFTQYFGKPAMDQETKAMTTEAGIDTSTGEIGTLRSMKSKIKDAEELQLRQSQKIDNELN